MNLHHMAVYHIMILRCGLLYYIIVSYNRCGCNMESCPPPPPQHTTIKYVVIMLNVFIQGYSAPSYTTILYYIVLHAA